MVADDGAGGATPHGAGRAVAAPPDADKDVPTAAAYEEVGAAEVEGRDAAAVLGVSTPPKPGGGFVEGKSAEPTEPETECGVVEGRRPPRERDSVESRREDDAGEEDRDEAVEGGA